MKNVTKSYDGKKSVIEKFSFDFSEGTIYSIFGENGSGKTTLLNILSGYLNFEEGNIEGNDDVLLITEDVIPFDYITGLEFVHLTLRHKKKIVSDEVVNFYLQEFGMLEFKDDYLDSYSSGMKYKILMILTFIIKPKVLLLDEPFSELDIITVERVNQELQRMKESSLIIFSTHISSLAFQISDKILFLTSKKFLTFDNQFSNVEMLEQKIQEVMTKKIQDSYEVIDNHQ
ncbi:ATP-binding cassette domain-containing protein [Pseudolactococcus yaeyamensis]